jgi:hypothetical protein
MWIQFGGMRSASNECSEGQMADVHVADDGRVAL